MRTMLDTVLTYVASLAGLQAPAPAPDRKSLGTQPLYVVSRDRIIVPWSGTHTVFWWNVGKSIWSNSKAADCQPHWEVLIIVFMAP
jgi:hypothetical protein